MSRLGLDAAATESLVRLLPEDAQREARAVLDWLLPEGDEGLENLSQYDLQNFLWYYLPVKWLVEPREHHEAAWALGDLLESAGLTRYAGLCRSNDTHLLIDLWDTDQARARRTLRRISESSGVDPLDTETLQWGAVFGMAEAAARAAVSNALEAALDAGRLTPGAPRWKAEAGRIINEVVARSGELPGAATLLEAIWAERTGWWVGRTGTARMSILGPVLPRLSTPIDVPDSVDTSLEPLRWLLHQVGEGVTMTQAGYLPKALVLAANDRFRWFDLPGFSVRTEHDLPQLAHLHELAKATRLLTRRGRRLTVSAAGRRALGEPHLLWRNVTRPFFDGTRFEGDGSALAVACLTVRVAHSLSGPSKPGSVAP